jgi:hypothetical protein
MIFPVVYSEIPKERYFSLFVELSKMRYTQHTGTTVGGGRVRRLSP